MDKKIHLNSKVRKIVYDYVSNGLFYTYSDLARISLMLNEFGGLKPIKPPRFSKKPVNKDLPLKIHIRLPDYKQYLGSLAKFINSCIYGLNNVLEEDLSDLELGSKIITAKIEKETINELKSLDYKQDLNDIIICGVISHLYLGLTINEEPLSDCETIKTVIPVFCYKRINKLVEDNGIIDYKSMIISRSTQEFVNNINES